MPKALDLAGRKIGKLQVLHKVDNPRKNGTLWRVICECGVSRDMLGITLNSPAIRSCGCVKRAVIGDASRTHGMRKSRAYYSWHNMHTRCRRENSPHFKDYGGRGIKVDATWFDFQHFLADMGEPPAGMTLERLDNDGNYCKDNCRWADRKMQANNRRSSLLITSGGETKTLAQWVEISGIGRSTISYRLAKGWAPEDAIFKALLK